MNKVRNLKIKSLLIPILILGACVLPSCTSNIEKYVGTYSLYSWYECDYHTYLGEETTKNEEYHYIPGNVSIFSDGSAIFYGDSTTEDKKVKVDCNDKYIRFLDAPIPESYRFELVENVYIGEEERVTLLRYSERKLTDGLILNKTEHYKLCSLRLLDKDS